MTVRVRFAPSPTGYPHIGNIRTVVFNWLFARKEHGKFIVRIEDTDRKRYVEDAVQQIIESLRWLGMDWDEGPEVGGEYGPYYQSQRLKIYQEKAQELVDKGLAYRCNCSEERLTEVREAQRAAGENPGYDGLCRHKAPGDVKENEPHVIRLKVPQTGSTSFSDVLRGDITIENNLLDDQVLLKSDGFPTYHLAVVVDDHLMGITHVMRGDDWIPSTPKRVLLYQAFGWEPPIYIHVPLVVGADGKKLSKRHGATSVDEFRRAGYLPEALLNFLAMQGWSPGEGEEQEIFSVNELINRFDYMRINLSPAVFSYDKLNWMNGMHIRAMENDELLKRCIPFWQEAGLIPTPVTPDILPKLRVLVPLIKERIKTLQDVVELTDFVFDKIEPQPVEALIGKNMTMESSLDALKRTSELLAKIPHYTAESMEQPFRDLASALGLKAGQLFGIIRNAVSGKTVTPPLFGCVEALGREETLRRLVEAQDTLSAAIAAAG